jgi:hypothetical protein
MDLVPYKTTPFLVRKLKFYIEVIDFASKLCISGLNEIIIIKKSIYKVHKEYINLKVLFEFVFKR